MPDVNGLGDKIVTTVRSFVARSVEPIETRLKALEDWALMRQAPEKGERGADGKDGADGADGKDGERGADGKDGADGRSITPDEINALIEPLLQLRFAAWELEQERRLPETLQRMVDRIERPKDGAPGRDGRDGVDGKDGKDGEDGFDLRQFEVIQTDERSFTLRFKDLRREIKHAITLPVPIGRGIWQAGRAYQRGDVVTWGGSSFEKIGDGDGKPEDQSKDWRLMVKRGRDGKDGERGERGETGKAGRNGRDLTQLTHDGSKY